jgi:hypothetical protein
MKGSAVASFVKPGAAALAFLLLVGISTNARNARGAGPSNTAPISDEARGKFNVGVTLLTDPEGPRYEEAYRQFKAAYAISPSSKILGNLGLCAMKLERDDEAIAAYEKYVADVGKDLPPGDLKQITDDLATLKAAVGHVTVESDPPGAQIFDARIPVRGERVLNDYGAVSQATKLGLHEGAHQLTARLAGYTDQTWDVDIAGGQEVPPHKFVFTKEPTASLTTQPVAPPVVPPTDVVTSRPVGVGVWVGLGVTGALTAATVVTSVMAMSNHNDYETALADRNVSKQNSLKDSGQTINVVADACLGGAVAAAVVTGVLYFTRPTVTTESGHARNTLTVVPSVGLSTASLDLQGTF